MSTIPFSMCDPEGEMLCAPSCATSTRRGAITINAVDDPAVITGDTSGSGAEDTAITGDLNARDPERLTDDTYFTVSTNPSNGTASIPKRGKGGRAA